MSNFPNMDGQDLFTVPFGSPQPVKQMALAQQPRAPNQQQPNIPQKPVPDKKTPALQTPNRVS